MEEFYTLDEFNDTVKRKNSVLLMAVSSLFEHLKTKRQSNKVAQALKNHCSSLGIKFEAKRQEDVKKLVCVLKAKADANVL